MCKFDIYLKEMQPDCNIPYTPPNSALTCKLSEDRLSQICTINCLKDYESAVKQPQIVCNGTHDAPEWLPKLDKIICQKPIPGRAKKTIPFTFDGPCQSTPEYYETTAAILTPQIRAIEQCASQKKRIGFCSQPVTKYMKLECNNDRRMAVNLTVELTDLENIDDTLTAVKYVKIVEDRLRKVASDQKLTIRGTDKEEIQAREIAENLENSMLQATILCDDGYKALDGDKGCVQCPKGTKLVAAKNLCQFCPIGTFQGNPGFRSCEKCPEGKTTKTEGTVSVWDCIQKPVEDEDSNGMLTIVVAAVLGFVLILIIMICCCCKIAKNRRRKREIHEQSLRRERARREKEERRLELAEKELERQNTIRKRELEQQKASMIMESEEKSKSLKSNKAPQPPGMEVASIESQGILVQFVYV